MNTTPSNTSIEFPPPIINDARLPSIAFRHPPVVGASDGTRFNPVTGECRVVRLVGGLVYDTDDSELVASVCGTDAAKGLSLRRLYRAHHGRWFVIHLQYWHKFLVIANELMWPLPDYGVLPIARSLVPDKDCLAFLLDWYGGNFLPRDDDLVQEWAVDALSPTDLERFVAMFESLPPAPNSDKA